MSETEAEKIIREEKEAADKLEAERKTATAKPAEAAKPTKSEDMISAANAAAARIEEANTETARLNAEAAALKVETTLGGEAEAGTGNKEETPEEYAKKVMANDVEQEPPAV